MAKPPEDAMGSTRARILATARTIAEERGYRGTTLSRIQKAAGVHPGSLYWFFADKDALFAALVADAYAELGQPWGTAYLATSPNPVLLTLVGIVDNPRRYGLWRFNVQLMLDPDMHESKTAQVIQGMRRDTQQVMIAAWLNELAPEVTAAQPDLARRLAEYALVTVEGCVLSRVAGRPVDEDTVTAAATTVLDRMVADACHRASMPVPDYITGRSASVHENRQVKGADDGLAG